MSDSRKGKSGGASGRRLANIILYAALLGSALTLIFAVGGSYAYIFFYAAAALPALALIQSLALSATIKAEREATRMRVMKNESFTAVTTLANRGPFPAPSVTAELRDDYFLLESDTLACSIMPFGKSKSAQEISFPYRGVYNIGVQSVSYGNLLGIFSLKRRVHRDVFITVCPDILMLERVPGLETASAQLKQGTQSDPLEVAASVDSRLYRQGDGLNRLHWKLIARKDELITRVFEDTQQPVYDIFLDLRRFNRYSPLEALACEDRLVESCVAVALYLLERGIPIRLTFGRDARPFTMQERGRESFERVYSALSEVTFDSAMTLEELAASLPSVDTAVVISGGMKPENALIMRESGRFGLRMTVITAYGVEPDDLAKKEMAAMTIKGVTMLCVTPEQDLANAAGGGN